MTRSAKIDPSRIPDDAWEPYDWTPTYRRYICMIDDEGSFALKTEYLGGSDLIDLNQELLNDSYGKRFGEEGQVVARIPLNILHGSGSEINKKMQEGDEEHLKWWLNSEQARPWRTFRGKL
jgi:hypothetical protein